MNISALKQRKPWGGSGMESKVRVVRLLKMGENDLKKGNLRAMDQL
jgi:hypothetical protein